MNHWEFINPWKSVHLWESKDLYNNPETHKNSYKCMGHKNLWIYDKEGFNQVPRIPISINHGWTD